MIYTVTLNPAVDYVISLSELKSGFINRSQGEKAFVGGKGINVSVVLKELGTASVATGFVAGFTGEAIKNGLSEKGIACDFVELKSGMTRINVKLRADTETDINGKGPDIAPDDVGRLLKKLERLKKDDILILSGSAPKGISKNIYAEIAAGLTDKGVKFAVDAEGELLLNTLRYSPFLVKPNLEELSGMFGTEITDVDGAFEYAERLKKAGAVNVLVSMGALGAVLLDEYGKKHFAPPVAGKAVNTTGAGDSMLAGFISGYTEKGDYNYALRLGAAAGGATAFCDDLADGESIFKLL